MKLFLPFFILLIFFKVNALPARVIYEINNHPTQDAILLAKFPFKVFSDGVILIRAQLNDSPDSLNFIFDTGCSTMALDSVTCLSLKIQTFPSNKYVIGVGGKIPAIFTPPLTCHFPQFTIDSLKFHVADYEILSQTYGVHIDGIIGNSVIKDYIIQVNFDSLSIAFYDKGKFKYPHNGRLLKLVSKSFQIPIVSAPIKNKIKINGNFFLDMGAGLHLMFSKTFIEDSSVLEYKKNKRKTFSTEAQGLGGKIRMNLTTLPKLKIGPYRFREIPLFVFDDVSGVTQYPMVDGVLGNDLMRRFNITLNYANNEVFLQPNSHYNDLFDYSYTGLCMYFIDGKVIITDIIPNSPAEKYGFKAGDIVLGVDNNFKNDIDFYQTLLKRPNQTSVFLISRNNEIFKLNLKIGSIL